MKDTYKLTTIDTPIVTIKGKDYACMTYPMSFDEFLEENKGKDIYLFEATDKQVRAVVRDFEVVWVTEAHNKNYQNNHSYIVGVYENYETAEDAAYIEEHNRSGKYSCCVVKHLLNELPQEIIDNEI